MNVNMNRFADEIYDNIPSIVCRRIHLGEGRDWFGFENGENRGIWWRADYVDPTYRRGRYRSKRLGGWSRRVPGGLQFGTM
jgi:hypothetical protein